MPSAHDITYNPEPYRGPDRRGVARFVVPVWWPTIVMIGVAVGWIFGARRLDISYSGPTIVEVGAIGATLAITGGIASVLRWRLDGIARGWWFGWGLGIIGAGQLAIAPIGISARLELGVMIAAFVLFLRAIAGPEVDAAIRPSSTLVVLGAAAVAGVSLALSLGTTPRRAEIALAALGGLWAGLAGIAIWRRARGVLATEAGWIIPVSIAFALAELITVTVEPRGAALLGHRAFALFGAMLASVGAVGGLVRAAVHHRTRALREHIEHERELANRRRVEESFADRLHEMRSTVVAIEGGVSVWGPEATNSPDASLRAALIAEIRRLRTLINESPAAAGAEAFDVSAALAPTIALQCAGRQVVTLEGDGNRAALGRPADVVQVVQGLLANAAKYAPGSPVRILVLHELDEIAIRVEDRGPGVDPEFWDLIFERGFRVDPDTGPTGSGLGLHVARRLMRDQDGDLWVEQTVGGGATFVLSLPAAPALRILAGDAEGTALPPDIAMQEAQ